MLLTRKVSTQKHRNPENKHFGYTEISLKTINNFKVPKKTQIQHQTKTNKTHKN